MKKRIFAIVAALMMASAPMMAQVFLDDEELYNNRAGTDVPPSMYVENPGTYDSGEDWYTPVGEGLLALAGLAGAYLIGKRKHKD